MPNIDRRNQAPVRQLGQLGVIADTDPYDLPPNAWSMGVNVRFRNGRVHTAPVMKNAYHLATANPRFMAAYIPESGLDQIFFGYKTGQTFLFNSSGFTETDYSLACSFNGQVSGTTLTVNSVASGALSIGMTVSGTGLTGSPTITALGTGTGGTGTYTLSASFSIGAESMTAAYTQVSLDATWTSVILANCIYMNRADRAPWALTPGTTNFNQLPNWPAATTCELIRQAGGALVALNITANGQNTPNMLLTSSFATAGAVPTSWDYTNPATLATQQVLAEIEGPIQDAQILGRDLVIYSNDQAWRMTLSGDQNVWNLYKLPFQKGSINANCSVQVASKHYVFGPTDIWVHDGVSEKSICNSRVKDFIYGNINMSAANRCFILHDQHESEIHFNFISGDGFLKFVGTPDGCNRCAVYNYDNDTWTFDDRPLVYGGDWANLDSVLLWSTVTQAWNTIQGSWQDQQDTQKRCTCYIGDVNSTYNLTASLYACDPVSSTLPGAPPSIVSFATDANATGYPYLERNGIDLDEAVDLQGYKLINYILPLGRIDQQSSQDIQFSFGAADGFNETPTFSPYMGYDGITNYKLDFNQAGRYLFMKVQFNDHQMFTLSGIDIDVTETGER